MQLGVAGILRREFAGRSEAAAFRHFQQQQREERKRRDREDNVDNDATDLLDMMALIVTEVELRELRFQIDRYDAATVEALQMNEIELQRAREHLDQLLARAHVLPDGRRVFKTEDGSRVFDEFGQELTSEIIAPDEIDDSRPRWEVAQEAIDKLETLTRERAELLEYQARLDEARERLDAGDLTREDFERLRGELTESMPEAVRSRIPELADEQEPKAEVQVTQAAIDLDLDISEDMIPDSPPRGLAPGLGT